MRALEGECTGTDERFRQTAPISVLELRGAGRPHCVVLSLFARFLSGRFARENPDGLLDVQRRATLVCAFHLKSLLKLNGKNRAQPILKAPGSR